MGTVKICVHKMAKNPYFVEATGTHLYSIEELSYYLCENIYLVDDRIVGEKLYLWLEKELGLEALGEKLRNGRDSGNHVYNQVMTILNASEYYSEAELQALSEKIKEISALQTQERMKYKADELAENKKYWAAISEYERLLSIRQNTKLTVEFYAKVWNNLAGCYARLFLFEKAAACYESAYQFQKIVEYKEKAYYARKLARYGEEEPEELLENKISEEFLQHAEDVLKVLEEKSRIECEDMNPEDFLKAREKSY